MFSSLANKWKQWTTPKLVECKVATWNIGSHTDFRAVCPDYALESDQKIELERISRFKKIYQSPQFEDIKIICMQEVLKDDWKNVNEILPNGFIYKDDLVSNFRDTLIAWNPAYFTFVSTHIISVDMTDSVVVILKSMQTNAVIGVCSGHISGFNLATNENFIKEVAEVGDIQIAKILDKLATIKVDIIIFGADLNTPQKCYSGRHDILVKKGYVVETSDEPTFKDKNIGKLFGIDGGVAVKLDSIAAWANKTHTVAFQNGVESIGFDNCAGDHCPVVSILNFT